MTTPNRPRSLSISLFSSRGLVASTALLGLAAVGLPTTPTLARQPASVRQAADAPAKRPADSLDGPPFVSARAWAIADGRTGAVLWGDRQDEPFPMASTTKMMTALIVSRVVDREPDALDRFVTFSKRADDTIGSTSGIRAGEKVRVGDLLHGLLLPSGNDAATAFGEAFGDRFKGADDDEPLARFVAEMNRLGGELGLRRTHFVNPHGLPADDHHASPADLAKLASVLLDQPRLAQVVSTPQYACDVQDQDGKTRRIVWKNTNRLLGVEGYDGVKTGTTTAAGNCLVASGRRGGDHLIVVVLGEPTSDGRYNDARNLFRWGWVNRRNATSTSRSKP